MTLGSAVALSSYFGIPQYIVGFYVIGLGTSLPELVTSFVALKRRASGMAVGNILGSNILDLLLVLGVGSVVSDLWVSSGVVRLDLPFLCGVTFFVLLFLFRAKKLSKKISITLVLGYILFSFLRFILIV